MTAPCTAPAWASAAGADIAIAERAWQRRRRAVYGRVLRQQAIRAQQVAVELAQADEEAQAAHMVP